MRPASCVFALQFKFPCAHTFYPRESAGMPLQFHINPRWAKKAEFTMESEFGITQAARQQTATSKAMSMYPAEMVQESLVPQSCQKPPIARASTTPTSAVMAKSVQSLGPVW